MGFASGTINLFKHFAHLPLILQGFKKSEILPQFSTAVAFDAFLFRNGATCRQSKICIASTDDWSKFVVVRSSISVKWGYKFVPSQKQRGKYCVSLVSLALSAFVEIW